MSARPCSSTSPATRSSQGYDRAGSHVAGDDDRSIAFAQRFGFEELRRDVQQVLEVDGAAEPREIDGVEFVSLEERPDLLEAAYPLAQEGYEDMPIEGLDISLETWLLEGGTLPEGRSPRSPTARSWATRACCAGPTSRRRRSTASPSSGATGAGAGSPRR